MNIVINDIVVDIDVILSVCIVPDVCVNLVEIILLQFVHIVICGIEQTVINLETLPVFVRTDSDEIIIWFSKVILGLSLFLNPVQSGLLFIPHPAGFVGFLHILGKTAAFQMTDALIHITGF